MIISSDFGKNSINGGKFLRVRVRVRVGGEVEDITQPEH